MAVDAVQPRSNQIPQEVQSPPSSARGLGFSSTLQSNGGVDASGFKDNSQAPAPDAAELQSKQADLEAKGLASKEPGASPAESTFEVVA